MTIDKLSMHYHLVELFEKSLMNLNGNDILALKTMLLEKSSSTEKKSGAPTLCSKTVIKAYQIEDEFLKILKEKIIEYKRQINLSTNNISEVLSELKDSSEDEVLFDKLRIILNAIGTNESKKISVDTTAFRLFILFICLSYKEYQDNETLIGIIIEKTIKLFGKKECRLKCRGIKNNSGIKYKRTSIITRSRNYINSMFVDNKSLKYYHWFSKPQKPKRNELCMLAILLGWDESETNVLLNSYNYKTIILRNPYDCFVQWALVNHRKSSKRFHKYISSRLIFEIHLIKSYFENNITSITNINDPFIWVKILNNPFLVFPFQYSLDTNSTYEKYWNSLWTKVQDKYDLKEKPQCITTFDIKRIDPIGKNDQYKDEETGERIKNSKIKKMKKEAFQKLRNQLELENGVHFPKTPEEFAFYYNLAVNEYIVIRRFYNIEYSRSLSFDDLAFLICYIAFKEKGKNGYNYYKQIKESFIIESKDAESFTCSLRDITYEDFHTYYDGDYNKLIDDLLVDKSTKDNVNSHLTEFYRRCFESITDNDISSRLPISSTDGSISLQQFEAKIQADLNPNIIKNDDNYRQEFLSITRNSENRNRIAIIFDTQDKEIEEKLFEKFITPLPDPVKTLPVNIFFKKLSAKNGVYADESKIPSILHDVNSSAAFTTVCMSMIKNIKKPDVFAACVLTLKDEFDINRRSAQRVVAELLLQILVSNVSKQLFTFEAISNYVTMHIHKDKNISTYDEVLKKIDRLSKERDDIWGKICTDQKNRIKYLIREFSIQYELIQGDHYLGIISGNRMTKIQKIKVKIEELNEIKENENTTITVKENKIEKKEKEIINAEIDDAVEFMYPMINKSWSECNFSVQEKIKKMNQLYKDDKNNNGVEKKSIQIQKKSYDDYRKQLDELKLITNTSDALHKAFKGIFFGNAEPSLYLLRILAELAGEEKNFDMIRKKARFSQAQLAYEAFEDVFCYKT